MTVNTYEVEPMDETPRVATSSLTTSIEDDPTLPTLTMTNGILVPVIDAGDQDPDSVSVPCRYYTVTSFCRNPKHLDLNYAKQQQLNWNNVLPITNRPNPGLKQKPREIIHKIQLMDDENSPPSSNEESNKNITHGITFRNKNNRACSVVNLTLEPVRSERSKRSARAATTPPQQVSAVESLPPDLRTARRAAPSPPPVIRHLPIAPPRNNKLSNFRSSSKSREHLDLQTAPSPGGSFFGNPLSQNQTQKPILTDAENELLAKQFAKKEKLRLTVQCKKTELVQLRREVEFLQKQLEPLSRIKKLQKENQRLESECYQMIAEVDSLTGGSIPLGETSADFYGDKSARQDANPPLNDLIGGLSSASGSKSPVGRLPTGTQQLPSTGNRRIPPPRPPPPRSLQIPWDCSKCTFRNHPDLSTCEQCQMIRFPASLNSTEAYGHAAVPSTTYFYS